MGEVAYLNNGEVYSDILDYINGLETENTQIRYERSIRLFFEWKYGVEIEHLKPEHLELDYSDMKKFKNYMRKNKKYSFNTINNTMTILISLFKELAKLEGNKYNLQPDNLRVKQSKVLDEESTGDINDWQIVDEWIEYFVNKDQKNKAYLLDFARITGIRKTGLTDLKWKDVKRESGYWVLNHTLKGKQCKTAIRDDHYEKLLELKKNDDPESKVFSMTSKTAERAMDEIKEFFTIDSESNISFHSLRKLSGQTLYDQTRDLRLVQNHLNHSDVKTTMKYVQKKIDLENSPSLYIDKEIPNDELEGMDSEEWMKLFNELSRSAKYEILNKKKEMGL